jgi:hypothetical protein
LLTLVTDKRRTPLEQRLLPFDCSSCLYNLTGRCDGPGDSDTYLMQDPSLVGCVDPIRQSEFLDDTYSELIEIPKSSQQGQIDLPPFIPGISTGLELNPLSPNSLVAISIGDIVGRDGDLLVSSLLDVKRRFGLPADSRIILIGTAQDSLLESLWTNSERHNIWKRVATIGFEWITSLSYSVWDEMPRTDQIRNQDRNLQTHDRFANVGVPCIPFLFPIERTDYLAVQQWFRQRPDVNTVAIEAQMYKNSRGLECLLQEIKSLEQAAKRCLHFVVVGPSTAKRIYTIGRRFSATFVTWKPFHEARTGSLCDASLAYSKSFLTRQELVNLNFQQYEIFCNWATRRLRSTA